MTRRTGVGVAVVAALACIAPATALSEQLTITHYDAKETPASGFGGWAHFYGGTITDTGRRFTGSASCDPPYFPPCNVVDETGGSGTLNDGITVGNTNATQLLAMRNDTSGNLIEPAITLYLGGASRIDQIRIYGNSFARLARATVTVGGVSVPVTTTAPSATLDVFDLTTTSLASLATDTIVLSDLKAAPFFGFPLDQVSISEIVVNGQPVPVDTTPPVITVPVAGAVADASGPGGALVDFLVTAIDDVDGPVPAICAPPSGSEFAIGDTTVTCSAGDAAGNTASASFGVHVRGAGEQLATLREAVLQANTRQGTITSLDAKLQAVEAALSALTAGNAEAAGSLLEAFAMEVRAQTGKSLTADDAAELTARAARIEAVLGFEL